MQRRILHTSDLHLDSVGDKACRSLEALVDLAIKTEVDLVIVAGDLFDHNGVDDNLVSFAVEQLQRLAVRTIILPGNHDCLAPGSVYQRVDFYEDSTNIQVFKALNGETLSLPELGVSTWGKPISSFTGDSQPLAGIPRDLREGEWHIAVAHGHYISTEADVYRSFHITHEQIVASGQDYIALGHCPVFRCICDEPVKAYYSGSASVSGEFAIVDLVDGAGVQVTRRSL